MSVLIAFEGIDSAGKTTQVELLTRVLKDVGLAVIQPKVPANGPWPLIKPSLEKGHIVVFDRYIYSNTAYQGARGGDPRQIEKEMKQFSSIPDAVIYLDVEPSVALRRISQSRREPPNTLETLEHLEKVREIFQRLAVKEQNFIKIDGHGSINAIHREILDRLLDGVLKRFRANPDDCDCWPTMCSAGVCDSCKWLRLKERVWVHDI
jgi:dTMP kinase